MNDLLKKSIIFICAAIASIGTYPYAKNFANHVFSSEAVLFLSGLFVFTALTANIALGSFSILDTLNLYRKASLSRFLVIGLIACIASIATGFICVVGYYNTLPLQLNILISFLVTCVNAAVAFSALHHASNHFFNKNQADNTSSLFKKFLILTTISAAFIASFVFYLATVNGLLSIFNYYHLVEGYQKEIAYIFAVLVWLPGATLFINASRITVSEIYETCTRKAFSFSWMRILLVMIAIFSGSSFAQMTIEFFDTSKQIPDFFRVIASQVWFVSYILMPITFIISGLVNAYALNNIFSLLKNSPTKT